MYLLSITMILAHWFAYDWYSTIHTVHTFDFSSAIITPFDNTYLPGQP